MPFFKIRTEAADGNYREYTTEADSLDAAKAAVEAKEQAILAFDASQLPAEDTDLFENRLDEVQARFDSHPSDDPKVALSGRDRAHFVAHNQTEPYVLVSAEEADLS